eukprot:SAG31_NODE_35097_length_326_cov_0.907489_1_plen_29_part_01
MHTEAIRELKAIVLLERATDDARMWDNAN